MATCTELYIDTLGGLDLDGSTDKNLPYFVVENLATLFFTRATAGNDITYDWYVEEWIRLAGLSYSTRDHNMADMTEQELLHHRLEDAALQLSWYRA